MKQEVQSAEEKDIAKRKLLGKYIPQGRRALPAIDASGSYFKVRLEGTNNTLFINKNTTKKYSTL